MKGRIGKGGREWTEGRKGRERRKGREKGREKGGRSEGEREGRKEGRKEGWMDAWKEGRPQTNIYQSKPMKYKDKEGMFFLRTRE
jgi:hypothetical protein